MKLSLDTIRRAGLKDIEANVTQGTLEEAKWLSVSANKRHGLPRSNHDKVRAVRTALQHPKGAKSSDSAIAKHVGVSQPFVGKVRSELAVTYNGYKSTARTGRDGRTIDTAKIGKRQRRKTQKPRSAAEFLEARRNGFSGRPTSLVKLELPNNHVHNCAYDLLRHFTFEYLQKVFQEINHIHHERLNKEESE